jgi:hypothetical protein
MDEGMIETPQDPRDHLRLVAFPVLHSSGIPLIVLRGACSQKWTHSFGGEDVFLNRLNRSQPVDLFVKELEVAGVSPVLL